MTDCLTYWKYFWEDVERDPSVLNNEWHTKSAHFFKQVKQGDSLWIIVSGGLNEPEEWRLLQRIVVKNLIPENAKEHLRPYHVIGDTQRSEKFDINEQGDITELLHKLKFASGKPITANGRAIGLSLQAIRPLAQSDILLFEQYSKGLRRIWSDVGLAESKIEKALRSGAGFGKPETNRQVEQAAIEFVRRWYEKQGWKVISIEREKKGFDLHCTNDIAEEHVEVKGVQGKVANFIITVGEVEQARKNPLFRICIVTNALVDPQMIYHTGPQFADNYDLKPIAFWANLRS